MGTSDTRPFHFQQFSLHHHRSTMKVGTDAVLLGIQTNLDGVKSVLDIGTGCGIISLLLAARKAALEVDAIEIDAASYEEATENFKKSPYAGRLHAFHADINRFAQDTPKKYDLIISNPPFFINDQRPERTERKLARHTDSLQYSQIIKATLQLMNPDGRLSVVLPYRESKVFLQQATHEGIHLHHQMLIFPKPCKEPNRINLLLGYDNISPKTEKFIIRNENGSFSKQYLDLVKNYYLSP